jgi:hypothetical protein
VLLAVLAAAVAVPLALAQTIDNVVVGASGRNSTHGFSPSLYVQVMVENEYTKTSFDGDSGSWVGPPYRSTKNPKLGGTAKAGWAIYFDKGISVEQAMAKHFIHGWAPFSAATILIPHVVGSTRVAEIKGSYLLTKGPGDSNTQFEGVLSFPLCRGVVTSARFSLLEPFSITDGLGGQFRVIEQIGDKDALSWNRDAAALAPAYVALKGFLPAAHVTAEYSSANPLIITGVVTDCSGARMPGAPVHVGNGKGRVQARAGRGGGYLLRLKKPGIYVVVAQAGGGTARSRRVHVH